ncbi:MAG: hypothetical protein O7A06_18065 [Acidobacteria bacterium]|nr:hypothetical protein [Acidobacteriota bacterium]MCZ6751895.1 hypothetical protein [Acidobacteriota bacterium]
MESRSLRLRSGQAFAEFTPSNAEGLRMTARRAVIPSRACPELAEWDSNGAPTQACK